MAAALFLSANLFSHTVAARLLLLLLGLALVTAAIARERQSLRIVPPLWLPFLLWGAWAALSIAWSAEPERSIKEWRNEVAYAAAAFWMCFVAAQAPRAARIMLPIFAVAAVTVCAVALYFFPQGTARYAGGWHGGAGNHSSAMLTLMPCAVMAAWYARQVGWPPRRVVLLLALAALCAISAYTTLNRTVWLGFALQFVVMGGLLILRSNFVMSLRITLIAVAAALAVVAVGAVITAGVHAERSALGEVRPMTRDMRLDLWREAAEQVEARPLTGHGFGRGVLRRSLIIESGERSLWHSHNLFLDALLQGGVVGLLLLLVLLGATVRAGWGLAREASNAASACGIAIVAIVAGMAMRNMTDVLWVRQNALLYWGVIAVLLAWGTRYATAPRR